MTIERGNGAATPPVTDRETGSSGGLWMGVRGPNNILCYDNTCNLVADLHVTSSNSICSGRI